MQDLEEVHESGARLGIVTQDLLDSARSDTDGRLAEKVCVHPQHHDLSAGKADFGHQRVEAIAFDLTGPNGAEGCGDLGADAWMVAGSVGQGDVETEHPPHRSVVEADRIRVLFDDLDAEAVEDRQDLAQRCAQPARVEAQRRRGGIGVVRKPKIDIDRVRPKHRQSREVIELERRGHRGIVEALAVVVRDSGHDSSKLVNY